MSLAQAPAWCAPWVGTPYADGGRGRDGCDCIGLFLLIQREQFGRDLRIYDGPNWSGRADVKTLGDAARAFAQAFVIVPPGEEREGDAVLLRVMGEPVHIGCVVAPGLMLHTERECDAVIENYGNSYWSRRIVAFHRAEAG